jgi:hypothetical protein
MTSLEIKLLKSEFVLAANTERSPRARAEKGELARPVFIGIGSRHLADCNRERGGV